MGWVMTNIFIEPSKNQPQAHLFSVVYILSRHLLAKIMNQGQFSCPLLNFPIIFKLHCWLIYNSCFIVWINLPVSQSTIKLSRWRPHHPQPFASAPQVEEVLILPLLLDAGVLGPVIEDPIQGEHPQPVALVDTCLPWGLQLHPRMSVIVNTLIA